MTTPTQAQIEAAKAQISWLRSLAQKEGKGSVDAIDARSLGRVADTLAALTAAAGEQYPNEATLRAVGWTSAAEADVPEQEHIVQKPGQKPGLLPSGNTAFFCDCLCAMVVGISC